MHILKKKKNRKGLYKENTCQYNNNINKKARILEGKK